MMKKTLFLLSALLLAGIGARATDYTSYMQTTSTTGWTGPSATQGSGNGPTVMDFGIEAYAYINDSHTYWPNAGKVLYQTITGLPKGTYKVQFYAFARVARVLTNYATEGVAEAFASGASTATQRIDIPTSYVDGHSGWTDGDIMTLICTVGSDGKLEYGLQNAAAGGQWYGIKEISLTLIDATDTWSGTAYAHGCTATFDDWSISGNSGGSFQRNTWSVEGETSGMVTPFVEYWVGGSNNLSDATISHKQLANLSEGYYTVSIDARAFNEGDETPISTGTVLYYAKGDGDSQKVSVDLATGTDNLFEGHFEYYGTYSVIANVSTAGTLDVGFAISGTNSDWVSWKNLDVVYIGTSLEYTIDAPECSASYVQPGSEVSITFPNCITPTAGEIPTLSTSVSITVGGTAVTGFLSYNGTTATVTFTMPESIGYGETVTVSVPAGLLSWSGTSVTSAAAEFTLTTLAMADQQGVYLYSTHAKAFLSRGGEHLESENTESYGKIATTDPYGIPVDITISDDGFATIKFLDSNLFMTGGGWAWTDGSETNAAKYTIDVLEVEGETVYQFSYDGNDDNYLYVNDEYWDWVANNGNFSGDNNLQNDITRTYWQIFTKEECDAYKEASILADHIAIAAAAGVTVTSEEEFEAYLAELTITDVTGMVSDYELASSTGSLKGWDVTEYFTDNWTNDDYGNEVHIFFTTNSNGTEIYMADTKLAQKVEGLKEGIYKVTLQGFVRQGYADNIVRSGLDKYDLSIGFIGANEYQTNLKPWASDREQMSEDSNYDDAYPNSMEQAAKCFTADLYQNELYTYVGKDGTLELSINCPDILDHGWMIFKNLTLTYLSGELTYSIDEPTCAASYVLPGSEVSITFPNCITPTAGETPTLSTSVSITVNGSAVEAELTTTGFTAIVTFTLPESIGYGETVTVIVPEGLLSWSGTSVTSAAAEFTLTTLAMADQQGVYLYSTHAKGFLSRGGEHMYWEKNTESYGKIAATDLYGIPVDITIGDDGFATIKFLDSNLFMTGDGWAWTDGSETNAAKYTIDVLEVEGETVYQFSYDGNDDNYLYVNDDCWDWVANDGNFYSTNNLQGDKTRTYWQIFTKEERDAYKADSILADHISIAAAAGVTVTSEKEFEAYLAKRTITDVTEMVSDHELASSTGSLTGWDVTEYWTDNWIDEDDDQVDIFFTTNSNGTEIYMADTKLAQKVEVLKEGIYKVTLQGFVRQGYADNIVRSGLDKYDLSIGFIGANEYQTNLKPWASDREQMSEDSDYGDAYPNSMEQAAKCFTASLYQNELYTYVGEDGTLELSINCPDILEGGWMIFKNLTLTYYDEMESIDWTLGAKYGTLILPFDYDLSSTGLTAYTGTISGTEMELTAVQDNKIVANTPYIIGGAEAAQTKYTFSGASGIEEDTTFTDSTSGLTGVLEPTKVGSGNYVLQNQNGTTAFYLVDDETTITCGAYHCYLDGSAVSDAGVKSITFAFGDDVATRIDAVETEETGSEAIYDLSGRRVAKAQKGIYIVNGKKMVIK